VKINIFLSIYYRNLLRFSMLLFCIHSPFSYGQILDDPSTMNTIRRGIRYIYNWQFEQAERVSDTIAVLYPGHPVNNLYRGMMIYWMNYPLIPSSSVRNDFEEEMNLCIELSDSNMIPDSGYEAEYLLADLCAKGLLLLFYADNNLSWQAIPVVRKAYRPLMRSFDFTDECTDLLYFSGLYNYYREAYPKVHPVYKAVAFLFPSGDMEKGLRELEKCAGESMAMRAEALNILSWIRMYFENDYLKSYPLCESLTTKYPNNVFYRIMYIKNLLLLKKYDEAEYLINGFYNYNMNPLYIAVSYIFNGLIQEKKYQNFDIARKLYNQGIEALTAFSPYGNGFAAFGYFGLSRISEIENDNRMRRIYHRKAMELTDFKKMTFDN
jgi:hypothetical protein